MGRKCITEDAIGAIDGVNANFNTSATYVVGTLHFYRNGDLQTDDCIIELGGTSFTLVFPPKVTDTIRVRYTTVV